MLSFKNLKLYTTDQIFERCDLNKIIKVASALEPYAKGDKFTDILKDKVIASLFYEPSTRTKFSFHAAAYKLGAKVITEIGPKFSSMYKGETLSDTLKVVEQYSDLIIMRHPKEGSAKLAASILSKPFLNAGDGSGEHPTQALLDIYTLYKEKQTIDNLNILLCGDLKFGRTIHSLLKLLRFFKINLFFVSPKQLRLPKKYYDLMNEYKIHFEESEKIDDFIERADIMYVTRIQKERFPDKEEYESLKDYYIINRTLLQKAKDNITIMHPLPRVNEISTDIDSHKGAAYFRQAANGVYVRMALMLLLTGRESQFIEP